MSFTFLRWVRFGVAAALNDTALAAGTGPRARVTVGVDIEGTGLANTSVQTKLSVFGPGDVSGIDGRQVIRTFPISGSVDFESTYFAHVEFDRCDLPWLFTPVAPDANGLLRPWFCLVVVENRDGVTLESGTPLPVVAIESGAANELPSLASISAWAHVQVSGDASAGAESIAKTNPERILARVLCPRVLTPRTSYIACVVPTYDVGVNAGMGRDVASDAAVGDAWTPATDSIQLPVYFHWEFTTGGAGDFKSLVTRLEPHAPGPEVGTRSMDISSPGFGTADLPPTTVGLGGGLRVVPADPPPISEALAQELLPVINSTSNVGPPIYGRWHAGATSVARGTGVPSWLGALNLDARYRVAAGLGTRVVQERQEDLMAAIWEQFGEIIRANQLLRQGQLAFTTAERIVERNLAPQPDAALLGIAGPALARILAAPGKTVRRAVADSCLPISALSGGFRRIARAHGPLERRSARQARVSLPDTMAPPAIGVPALIEALAAGTLSARAPQRPDGAVAAPLELLPKSGRLPPRRVPTSPVGTPPLLRDLAPVLVKLASRDVSNPCTPLNIPATAQIVRDAIKPDVAVVARVLAQLNLPDERVKVTSRLDPILAAPEIPTPMVGPLIECGQDYLLPGLDQFPPNTVSLVEPDAAFIESYFVGLNHEMGRELLWRGFPTDQRGTVFSRFWDRRGAVSSASAPVPSADIKPIAGWSSGDALGAHLTEAASNLIVLLIRGDLLQRYPRATIFMQQARWQRDTNGAILYDGNVARREPAPVADTASWDSHGRFPSFRGRAGGDVMFVGFMLTRNLVQGHERTDLPSTATDDLAGWYVVFQEQPTEPRFGQSAGGAATSPKAEVLAASLLRPAFRLFVHGSDLVNE